MIKRHLYMVPTRGLILTTPSLFSGRYIINVLDPVNELEKCGVKEVDLYVY